MSQTQPAPASDRRGGRGRGKRGGLGKHLRARGRGRGLGRPAEFSKRLLLDGEGKPDLTEEAAAEREKELREKYGRRKLGTNVDRYKEDELELDSDGEPIVEPEVDLAAFLERQRISDDVGPLSNLQQDEFDDKNDLEKSLARIFSKPAVRTESSSKKGKVQQIEWDKELDELNKEKKAAEATKDLKQRFRAKSDKLRTQPRIAASSGSRRKPGELQDAPALPLLEGTQVKPKTQIEEMEDFLDGLLG